MARAIQQRMMLPEVSRPGHRAGICFPLVLQVRCAVRSRGTWVEIGAGRTINLSSDKLTVTATTPLFAGDKLEVAIDWPVLLDARVRIQLMMWGKVARTYGTVTEVQVHQHEFRTCGERRRAAAACP